MIRGTMTDMETGHVVIKTDYSKGWRQPKEGINDGSDAYYIFEKLQRILKIRIWK